MKFSNFFDKKICDYLIKQDHIVDLLQIQELCIPKILKHENTIVVSSTGSGKTLCFVLPTLVNLNNEINDPQVLVLLPTNELSKQILSVYKHYATLFYNVTFYNAFNKHKSTKNINSKIILSSPSEVIRLIKEGQLNINHLETVILDEADMLYEFFHKE
ncbi:DEAD/DEAH box helicase [bacterium]|nr:DEAD/DEAH box helicase [bacterium]